MLTRRQRIERGFPPNGPREVKGPPPTPPAYPDGAVFDRSDSRPRVILSILSRGWILENIGEYLMAMLEPDFQIRTTTLEEQPVDECDLLVVFFWRELPILRERVRARRVVLVLNNLASWSALPRDRRAFLEVMKAGGVDAILAVSDEIAATARQTLPLPVEVIEDGIDLDLFQPLPFPERFTVGWTGHSLVRRDIGDFKGLGLIEHACRMLRVPLITRDFMNRIPHRRMPEEFYRHISVYVCASLSEGTPNPVMEALACGRPVVSTRVGIVPALINPGENGLIVDRSVPALAAALERVASWKLEERAPMCRKAIERNAWGLQAEKWRRWLAKLI
jgi:glycosyltransferase involved in cell wall biosynthesis